MSPTGRGRGRGWSSGRSRIRVRIHNDLGPRIFSADPGLPPLDVPEVVAVTSTRPVDLSDAPDYDEPLPLLSGVLKEDGVRQLRYAPGRQGSGTRVWSPASSLLRGTGSLAGTTTVSYSDTGAPPICNDVYHGSPTATCSLPVLQESSPERDGFESKELNPIWAPDPVLAEPGPPGTVKRSTGVGTVFHLTDLTKLDESSTSATSHQKKIALKSKNLACVEPKAGLQSGPPYHYLADYAGYLGLTDVIPVSELNLGSTDYAGEGLRTCSDSRFCQPRLPGDLPRRVRSPDRFERRWPVNSSEYSVDPPESSLDVHRTSSARFYDHGGDIVNLEESVLVLLPAYRREASSLLPDPMEVGVWKSLTRRGITGKSMLDRRDFGKSASFLGCPAFLDDQTGTEFLRKWIRSHDFCGVDSSDRLRDLLLPLCDLRDSFDPSSGLFRWDRVELHSKNDSLHWGYPLYQGSGDNPFGKQFADFHVPDVLFNAARFDHVYPKEADRHLIRLLFGLTHYDSSWVYLVTPLDLYRVQMMAQIRAYSLGEEDGPCPHGRDRLRQIDPGNWHAQITDVDSHGLGVVEFAALALTIITCEVALHPTELTEDGQPAFFFDHSARGHDGLVLSGGEGGKKKCFQFLEALICGVRGRERSDGDHYIGHRRTATSDDVLQPQEKFYYDAVTGRRYPPVTRYDRQRPHHQAEAYYQTRFSRKFADALCAGLYAFISHAFSRGPSSGTLQTSCRFSPDVLPTSWQEWHSSGRHVGYYGGTVHDVVSTFEAVARDVETGTSRTKRLYRAYQVSVPQSAHFAAQRAFCRGNTRGVDRRGSQLFHDCIIDRDGEPLGLPLEQIVARRCASTAPAPVEDEVAASDCESAPSSPVAKSARLTEDNEA
ncbi:unnamed protein product [Oikopleura dioica]|uniref:Uncharacterized protein n=1 Tax=Oikopleura dioica TaxID=34765 RepID=E4YVM1_OIKDI|nr:unnamed protein product [Oikopleura dioica]